MPTIHGSRSMFTGAVAVPAFVKCGGTHPVQAVHFVKFFDHGACFSAREARTRDRLHQKKA